MAGKAIADLPLTTRNYTNLLGLSAGANTGVFNAANLGKGTQDISVNGSNIDQNNFQMDGVSIISWGTKGKSSTIAGTQALEFPIRMRFRNSRSRPLSTMRATDEIRAPM